MDFNYIDKAVDLLKLKKGNTKMNENQSHLSEVFLADAKSRLELMLKDSRKRLASHQKSELLIADNTSVKEEHDPLLLDREVNARLAQDISDFISHIAGALKRIDKGEYGLCADCGFGIPKDRLENRLTAERCFDCQSMHEIKEKQHAA